MDKTSFLNSLSFGLYSMPTSCLWLLVLGDLDRKIVYSIKFTVIFVVVNITFYPIPSITIIQTWIDYLKCNLLKFSDSFVIDCMVTFHTSPITENIQRLFGYIASWTGSFGDVVFICWKKLKIVLSSSLMCHCIFQYKWRQCRRCHFYILTAFSSYTAIFKLFIVLLVLFIYLEMKSIIVVQTHLSYILFNILNVISNQIHGASAYLPDWFHCRFHIMG